MTVKYRRLYRVFNLLSLLASVGPLTYFFLTALFNGEIATAKKVSLSFALIMCGVLVLLNTIKKYNLRSPAYILIIGLYFCIDNLLALFFIMAITTILDEFVFTPLKKKYKAKYEINKEIDKRE